MNLSIFWKQLNWFNVTGTLIRREQLEMNDSIVSLLSVLVNIEGCISVITVKSTEQITRHTITS